MLFSVMNAIELEVGLGCLQNNKEWTLEFQRFWKIANPMRDDWFTSRLIVVL